MINSKKKFIPIYKLENILKNFLIFIPLIISNQSFTQNGLFNLLIAFFIFSFLTSVCYITNDFTDRERDKVNKLKKEVKQFSKRQVILLNFLLHVFFVFLFFFTQFFNIFFLIYLIFFYLYNFIFKKFFLIDLFFLTSFYLIRIYLGADIINISITFWFILFFTFLFLLLSILKRITQINFNNSNDISKIISYSKKDLIFLKKLVVFSAIISLVIFSLYILNTKNIQIIKILSSQNYNYELTFRALIFILITYFFWLIRLIRLVFLGKISMGLYSYIIRDKISYFIGIFIFVILFLNKYLIF